MHCDSITVIGQRLSALSGVRFQISAPLRSKLKSYLYLLKYWLILYSSFMSASAHVVKKFIGNIGSKILLWPIYPWKAYIIWSFNLILALILWYFINEVKLPGVMEHWIFLNRHLSGIIEDFLPLGGSWIRRCPQSQLYDSMKLRQQKNCFKYWSTQYFSFAYSCINIGDPSVELQINPSDLVLPH